MAYTDPELLGGSPDVTYSYQAQPRYTEPESYGYSGSVLDVTPPLSLPSDPFTYEEQQAAQVPLPAGNVIVTGGEPVGVAGVGLGAGIGVIGGVDIAETGRVINQTAEQFAGGDLLGSLDTILAGISALGIAIPEPITSILGVAGAAYMGAQALGLGEGGGILGNNLLGGDGDMTMGNVIGGNIVLQGPGLKEPLPTMIVKEWHVNGAQFYLLIDGRIAVYSKRKKRWKVYRPAKLAVIGKNMPRHQMITRLRRNLKRHKDDAKTILKIADPTSYMKSQGYRKPARRRR